MQISRRGLMFVLSSPSGAGKTSLSKSLLASDDKIKLSVSVTTRVPRPGEINGIDYFFKTKEEYDQMLKDGELLEHARVFENYYGTPKKPVEEMLSNGFDVIFDIDWQGTQQLSEKCRPDMVRVFILPPSTQELENRLKGRGTDSDEVIEKRMAQAQSEISHWSEYDYVIINSKFEDSLLKIKSILTSERLKRSRQIGLVDFVNILRGEEAEED
jgi:guanylate kinase